jgi:Novel STAND NTPase 1
MADDLKISGDVERSVVIQGDDNKVYVFRFERADSVVGPPRSFEASGGVNPYKGLLSFEEADANRFFGREKLIEEVYRRFVNVVGCDEGVLRILPVLGPSGSGKSSLIRAGLVPHLARERLSGLVEPRVLVLQPGSHPLEALARALARFVTGDSVAVSKTRELFEELKLEGRADGLRRIVDGLPMQDPVKLILLIDQFEEIYVAPAAEEERRRFETERDRFVATLLDAAVDRSGRLLAILVMRSDFFGATQRHPALNAHLARAGFLIPAMGKEELERAIREPARLAGHSFPEAFVDLLRRFPTAFSASAIASSASRDRHGRAARAQRRRRRDPRQCAAARAVHRRGDGCPRLRRQRGRSWRRHRARTRGLLRRGRHRRKPDAPVRFRARPPAGA